MVLVVFLGVPLLAALVLARAGHFLAVLGLFAIICGFGAWLFLQSNGTVPALLDRTSAAYLLIFACLPMFVAAAIGALIGWIINRNRSA